MVETAAIGNAARAVADVVIGAEGMCTDEVAVVGRSEGIVGGCTVGKERGNPIGIAGNVAVDSVVPGHFEGTTDGFVRKFRLVELIVLHVRTDVHLEVLEGDIGKQLPQASDKVLHPSVTNRILHVGTWDKVGTSRVPREVAVRSAVVDEPCGNCGSSDEAGAIDVDGWSVKSEERPIVGSLADLENFTLCDDV